MRMPYRLLTLVVAGGLLAACASSPPSKFYTLAGAGKAGPTPVPAVPVFIEMLPVSVSERLARPQIVLRGDGHQLDIREQDRWASPFNYELRDALAAAIVGKSGATDVTKGGRPSNVNTYRIAIDLQQFDAVMGQEVRTVFGWTIAASDGSKPVVCKVNVNETVGQPGVEGVVGSVQHAVDRVAGTIAANVLALSRHQTPDCRLQ